MTFIFYLSKKLKINVDVSCESSICSMNFSEKQYKNMQDCPLAAAVVIGALNDKSNWFSITLEKSFEWC